jgi:hypothetical protein
MSPEFTRLFECYGRERNNTVKNNCIPKSLVPLEKLFDNNGVARNPKVTSNDS